MPKVKSHSASKKRFKRTGGGKIKRSKAYKRHHAWAKSPKQGRNLRGSAYMSKSDHANISILIPY
ncbi:50S ribosomal protein L35 [Candidatus Babeliales bacterium]|nr:50S ribosomal protein L35 [Candidatus Babeliales bacterium]